MEIKSLAEHPQFIEVVGFTTVEIFWVSYMLAGFYSIKD
jgi:hypothetical protein